MPDILILAGDGIGPEVMAEVKKVVAWFNARGMDFRVEDDLVGGCAYDAMARPSRTRPWTRRSRPTPCSWAPWAAPKWDKVAYEVRPEAGPPAAPQGPRALRQPPPAKCFDALADFSSLKRELVEGLDILIVRELTGGVYFGEPKEIRDLGNGPEARRRHPGLRHLRDRAHRRRGLRARALSGATASAPWRSAT
jgi:3-isopropylmalate dehydrogenase